MPQSLRKYNGTGPWGTEESATSCPKELVYKIQADNEAKYQVKCAAKIGDPRGSCGSCQGQEAEATGGSALSEPLERGQPTIRWLSLRAPGTGVGTELILGKHLLP